MEPYSIAELYQGLAMTTLTSRPGTAVHYSNYGFGVVGHVLERVTGQAYEALLHESFWQPLAMAETKINLTAADLERFAAHYWPKAKRVERARWVFGEVCGLCGRSLDGARSGPLRGDAPGGRERRGRARHLVREMREPVARSARRSPAGSRGLVLHRPSETGADPAVMRERSTGTPRPCGWRRRSIPGLSCWPTWAATPPHACKS